MKVNIDKIKFKKNERKVLEINIEKKKKRKNNNNMGNKT